LKHFNVKKFQTFFYKFHRKLLKEKFCKNLLDNYSALWTFLTTDDIELTNNHAEGSLRPLAIWRKKYFCTRSDYGSELVARSASIITTCKLNGKSFFEFLTTLITNNFAGKHTSARLLIE
jgi:transposase